MVSSVATPHVISPCSTPSKRISIPASQAATQPPSPSAIQLLTTHHTPAPIPRGSGANDAVRSSTLGAELVEVVDGQAEGGDGAVRGSPLRPRSHHPVCALVSSVQTESSRLGRDDGRARPVD